ncbi:MAG: LysM peptidoglycan-binding domain-containing protein, partial [Candidatus Puniceispirillaceae bacterium]
MQIQITRFLKPVIFSGLAMLIGLSGCQTKMPKMPKMPEISLSREAPAPVEEAPLREARQLLPVSGEIIVAPGDSIFSIATRYQITPQSIINDNQLVPPFDLIEGERLKLSPARYHVVSLTDNLYDLSQRYAVSQEQLAALNELQKPYQLTVGQRLLLPE